MRMRTKTMVTVLLLAALAAGAWFWFRSPGAAPGSAAILSVSGEISRITSEEFELRYMNGSSPAVQKFLVPPGIPFYKMSTAGERTAISVRKLRPGDKVVVYSKTPIGSGPVDAYRVELLP